MATPSRASQLNPYNSRPLTSYTTTQPNSGVSPYAQAGVMGAQAGFGAFKAYSTLRAGRAKEQMAKYNAKMVLEESRAEDLAMKEQGRRLAESQRDVKATQRMSVAGRGGLMGGTDLMTLADEAEKMQLDQLEIVRQRDIGKTRAMHRARELKRQGKAAKRASRWTAATGLIGDIASIGSMGMA